jgi:hypothetical protein
MFCDDTIRIGSSIWPLCFVKGWDVFCDGRNDDVSE